MARRRRQEPQRGPDDAPDWLWEFDGREWGWHSKDPRAAARAGLSFDGHHAAKVKWGEACMAWLGERGLVTRDHYPCTWQEFKRIEREEPQRVLRRPDPPAA